MLTPSLPSHDQIKPLPHTWLGAYYDLEASPPTCACTHPSLGPAYTPHPHHYRAAENNYGRMKPSRLPMRSTAGAVFPIWNLLGHDVACGKKGLVLRSPRVPDQQHPHEHLPLPCKARMRLVMRAPAYLNIHAFIRFEPRGFGFPFWLPSRFIIMQHVALYAVVDLYSATCTKLVAMFLDRKPIISTKTLLFAFPQIPNVWSQFFL